MIAIRTDHLGRRTITFPPALLEVAKRLFPDEDEEGAVFSLARRLTADRFATVAHIAAQDVESAIARAAEWLESYSWGKFGTIGTAKRTKPQLKAIK
jgi:hypothetical protein